MKIAIVLCVMLTLIVGCGKPAEPERKPVEPPKPQQQSSAEQVIETMAGYTDAKAGRRAKETIKKVADQKNKDLEEALEK